VATGRIGMRGPGSTSLPITGKQRSAGVHADLDDALRLTGDPRTDRALVTLACLLRDIAAGAAGRSPDSVPTEDLRDEGERS